MQRFINERHKTRAAPAHMWFGMSVENEQATSRIAHLKKANAGVRLLSVEPLIGHLRLDGIDWVIVGGEAVPMRYQDFPKNLHPGTWDLPYLGDYAVTLIFGEDALRGKIRLSE